MQEYTVEAATHICNTGYNPDFCAGWERNHRTRTTLQQDFSFG